MNALRAHGWVAKAHDDHFAKDTEDTVWIPQVSSLGWVILTKDAAIRTNELERRAMIACQGRMFALARGSLKAEAMAAAFIVTERRMARCSRGTDQVRSSRLLQ